jgi:hypothetical protein
MRYLFALLAVFFLWGCSVEVPRDEYVAYFDKNCKAEVDRSGIHFFALALTPDYEQVKWGAPLDSGMRVVFGATPRSDLSFETAFLISERDTAEVIVSRKMKTFELGVADMFVLSFANRRDGAKLRLKNVSHGIGGVELDLKNCKNIRLVENK